MRKRTTAEEVVRDEIARRGPIPFADFMALALGHPAGGYYAGAAPRPTREGDFLTAPELHPIFGAVLSRQVAEAWERLGRPHPFVLLEYGAGSGTLAIDILAGLRADGSALAGSIVLAPVEINHHRLADLRARAAAAGLPLMDPNALDAIPAPGMALANEFLDALPVHVLEIRGGEAREVHVGLRESAGDAGVGRPSTEPTPGERPGGPFVELLGPLSDPALAGRLAALHAEGIELEEGLRLEVCLDVEPWAREVGRRLAAGALLVIDYGGPAARLYGPRHRAGTLMTYRGHVADGDREAPYRDVGERDITAHVDTTALRSALRAAGFDALGETTQAELLAGCGLEDVLAREQERVADLRAGLELRAAVLRLLDPRHLGGFRAVIAAKGIDPQPPLRGLAFRGPGRG